jgi:putative ABC transport system permease protein
MACSILILLWVRNELSYDRYHENADRIYRLCVDGQIGNVELLSPVCTPPTAPTLRREFPEVLNAARIYTTSDKQIALENKQFLAETVFFADNTILDIFTFPIIKGNPQTPLTVAYSVVLTKETAKKYFGEEDPIGKVIKYDNNLDFTVTGVMENVPRNSHFTFDMLFSLETFYAEYGDRMEQWTGFSFYTYLLLAENSDYRELEGKFPAFINAHMGSTLEAIGGSLNFFLQPLASIHLHSHMPAEITANGDIMYVYLFAAIALFVLLIACANFINLTTARSATRAREVGIRKTFGAVRSKLIGQFLGESIIFSVLSLILGLMIVEPALPLFNSLTGSELSLDYLKTPWLIPGFMALAIFVGFIAGSYPAFFLSHFQPLQVLNKTTGGSRSRFRSVLVVLQFIISITLIVGTISIYGQLSFMRQKKLGINKEQIVVFPDCGNKQQAIDVIVSELAKVIGVENAAATSYIPGKIQSNWAFIPEGFSEDQALIMTVIDVDHNFIPTLDMEIIAGRNFSHDLITDNTESTIINETAAKRFGWEDPVGKTFKVHFPTKNGIEWQSRTVIGVVKDFHFESLHQKIEPLFMGNTPGHFDDICVKISSDNVIHTMSLLKEKWKELFPRRSFDYFFLDDFFDSQYRAEEKLGYSVLCFSLLAIFIGCLGLFGLASFTAEQRTKEIGIRKVLGASVSRIVGHLSKEFMLLVVMANIIAWPVAWFAMSKWLQNFTYRIDMGWWIFILSGALALFIALLTVSYQAIKAAHANPVDALRYE